MLEEGPLQEQSCPKCWQRAALLKTRTGDAADEQSLVAMSPVSTLAKCRSLPVLATTPADGSSRTSYPDTWDKKSKCFRGTYEGESSFEIVQSAHWWYFQECERRQVVPRMPRFLVKEPPSPNSSTADAASTDDGEIMRTLEKPEGVHLDVRCQCMIKEDLDALMEPLRKLSDRICSIDLSENHFTDSGIADFLAFITSRKVRWLNMAYSGAGALSHAVVSRRLEFDWGILKIISLEGTPFSGKSLESFCEALIDQGNIAELNLAQTGIGKETQRSVASVAKMMSLVPYLTSINIGGNHIFHEGCEALAEALKKVKLLTSFDMSHNATTHILAPRRLIHHRGWQGKEMNALRIPPPGVDPKMVVWGDDDAVYEDTPNFNPVALICEAMAENKSLITLHLANSGIDYCADYSLMAALVENHTLEVLDLSSNPHGEEGLRAILRMLMRDDSNIRRCDIYNFRDGAIAPGLVTSDLGAPSGHYDLELKHPQHRAVVRWLLHLSKAHGVSPAANSFMDIKWNGPLASNGKVYGPWCWPKENGAGFGVQHGGRLSFEYQLKVNLEGAETTTSAVNRWARSRRIPTSLTRFVTLFEMFNGLDTVGQQALLVGAIGDTCILKMCHLTKILRRCPSIKDFVLRTLFAHIENVDPLLLFEVASDNRNVARDFRKDARARFWFSEANPCGAFHLNLAAPMDHAVAERLHVINIFDASTAQKIHSSDTSQWGNYEGARNITFNDKHLTSFRSFQLRDHGTLIMDYVSPVHCLPRRDARAVSTFFIDDLVEVLERSSSAWDDKVMALKFISHHMVVSVREVAKLLRCFPNPYEKKRCKTKTETLRSIKRILVAMNAYGISGRQKSAFQYEFDNCRLEAFIILFPRCTDAPMLGCSDVLYNSDLFTEKCAATVQRRLGAIRTFDALNCCKPLFSKKIGSDKASARMRKTLTGRKTQASALAAVVAKEDEAGSEPSSPTSSSPAANFVRGDPADRGHKYKLNLEMYEEWVIALFLINLAPKENGIHIARTDWSARVVPKSDSAAGFVVPASWNKDLPHQGMFSLTYFCERDEYVNFKARRGQAEKWFGWEPLAKGAS
eukprot:gnl/TRDRNA2_/TRDRNA2_175813_c5_seq1.p1 gnl/TRDRNA2_/TRDRNA2_175813_c5~~gnl/TRDRNA2_/TRDRNA2_175813_c5_seq1.p1  ORF type:complete len:1083 (-),score=187.20 gnl/TRDRNA2_/TRDRNA2_175813_c5_seq1:135-3383(-)